jgi:hypothetical protein
MTTEVIAKIKVWLQDKFEIEALPEEVIAINFGIQKVFDGYELYQNGCDDYNEKHDNWMLSEIYEPEDNFYNLGAPSLNLSEADIYKLYKIEVLNTLKQKQRGSKHLKYITITYFNGQPELIETLTDRYKSINKNAL